MSLVGRSLALPSLPWFEATISTSSLGTLGRHFFGVDLNEQYVAVANARISRSKP